VIFAAKRRKGRTGECRGLRANRANWSESRGAPVSSEQLTTDHGQPTKMTFLKEPAFSLVSINRDENQKAIARHSPNRFKRDLERTIIERRTQRLAERLGMQEAQIR
jgi:hypothetical protein